jgi:hypothetical protein
MTMARLWRDQGMNKVAPEAPRAYELWFYTAFAAAIMIALLVAVGRSRATTEAAGAFGVEDVPAVPGRSSDAWAAPARAGSSTAKLLKMLRSLHAASTFPSPH